MPRSASITALAGAAAIAIGVFDLPRDLAGIETGTVAVNNAFKLVGSVAVAVGLVRWVWQRYRDVGLLRAALVAAAGSLAVVGGAFETASLAGKWLVILGGASIVVSLAGLAPRGQRRAYAWRLAVVGAGVAIILAAGFRLISGYALTRNEWIMTGIILMGLTLVLWVGARYRWGLAAPVFFILLGVVVFIGGVLGEVAELRPPTVMAAETEPDDLAAAVAGLFADGFVAVTPQGLLEVAAEENEEALRAIRNLEIDKELSRPAALSGIVVAGLAAAVLAFYVSRRWAWLLGLATFTVACAIVVADGLWEGAPPAFWAGAILGVEALLIAAFAFSRTTLRWVALAVLVVIVFVLARVSVNQEADAPAGETDPAAAIGLTDRIRSGGDAIATDILGTATGSESDTQLGAVAWLAIGVLGLVGYRQLEVVNGRRLVGPVAIEAVETKDDTEFWQTHMTNMIATEVHHPAEVPGGGVTAEDLSSVAAATLPPATGGVIASLVSVVGKAGFPPRGLTVRAVHRGDAASEDGSEPERHRVTASIADRRTGLTTAVRTLERDTAGDAFQSAAFAVVQTAISRSKTTPEWARWESTEAKELAIYHDVLGAPELTDHDAYMDRVAEEVGRLEEARALSPGNALIRLELGHRYALMDRSLAALAQYAAVRSAHPRQLLARYRLAATLDMMAFQLDTTWLAPGSAATPLRRDIVDQIAGWGGLAGLAQDHAYRTDVRALAPGDPETETQIFDLLRREDVAPGDRTRVRLALLHLARRELLTARRFLRFPAMVFHALAQSERAYWRQYLMNRQAVTWERRKVTALRLKVEASIARANQEHWADELNLAWRARRRALATDDEVESLTMLADGGWVTYYEAARFYATRIVIDEALGVDQIRTRADGSSAGGIPDHLRDQLATLKKAERARLPERVRAARVKRAKRRVEESLGPDVTELKRRAMRMLRRATTDPYTGFRQPPIWLTKDPDLEPLRRQPEYESWLAVVVPGAVSEEGTAGPAS